MAVNITKFEKAVCALGKALNEPKNDITRDASIQRFKFCIELAWKTARKITGHAMNFGLSENEFEYSDLDALVDPNSHDLTVTLSNIRERFEVRNFPYKVDIVLLSELAESYRENAVKDRLKI